VEVEVEALYLIPMLTIHAAAVYFQHTF